MVAIDMEMPSCCLWDCPLAREDGGACQLVDIHTSSEERPKDCPLVEIEERKVGKWIYHEKSISTGFKDLRECSCCHCYFRWEMPRNSFCPNCGADMRGREE